MSIFFRIFLAILLLPLSLVQAGEQKNMPVLYVKQQLIIVPKPEGKFIQKNIYVYNKGTDTLVIDHIKPSCSCSYGKLLKNYLAPNDSAMVMFAINIDGMYGDAKAVDFYIHNNSKEERIKITIAVDDTKADSLSKN